MRRAGGQATWTLPDGRVVERDTTTCAHCNTIVVVQSADPGGFCRMCMKATCSPCAGAGQCAPFERQLEARERSDRLLRAAKGNK